MTGYAEVVVALPVEGRFHYAVPERLLGKLEIGHRVLVPFRKRSVTGFIVSLSDTAPSELTSAIHPIAEQLDDEPLISPDVLTLATFAANYYLSTLGEVLKAALPPGLTATSVARYAITKGGARWLRGELGAAPEGVTMGKTHRRLLEEASKGTGLRAAKAAKKATAELETIGFLRRFETGVVKKRRARRTRESDEVLSSSARGGATPPGTLRALTSEQEQVLAPILEALDRSQPGAFLLRGVTGSGKTEVYLRAIERVRALGRDAIVLVPEISLTPQLEARFRERFFDDVVVLHSAMPDSARREGWLKLRHGEAHIALGPRSAVWAPVQNLGICVVDEEHDASFKQHSDVRYNGRDLAIARAHQARCVVVLGSATPSLETRHLAKQGRLTELRLAARVMGRPMPKIEIVDLAEERQKMKRDSRILSRALDDALRDVIARKEQAILFLNRRGFNTIVHCDDCGASRRCMRCDVSLTHHRPQNALRCHYCDHSEAFESPCRDCGGGAMRAFGVGTQRLVEAVLEATPTARVLRLDRDVVSESGALDRILESFRNGNADFLVGTQMVAKGHDFPRVTLVGVVLADSSLAFPDFRAAERTFQLLTQVAGRAGRAEHPGRVIIQTFQPKHYAIASAIEHDDDRFFEIEIASRRSAGYPPFFRMGLIRFESEDVSILSSAVARVASVVRTVCVSEGIRLRGPVPSPISKIRDRHRQMMMILAPTPAGLVRALRRIKNVTTNVEPKVSIVFDTDPFDLL